MSPAFSVMRRYKRPFDITILLVAHIFFAPLFLALWVTIPLLIWIEGRGPVFYKQTRMGKGGKPFPILKFRTLVPGASQVVRSWTIPESQYITKVGRVLRYTALDELPQVVNILKGDMSFVGPRAMPMDEFEEFRHAVPTLERRLSELPGLTGLAQVYGDGVRDPLEKLRYDLDYIERMNLWLDIKLLFLSVRNTLLGRWDRKGGNASDGA